jgi:hypothetical protein
MIFSVLAQQDESTPVEDTSPSSMMVWLGIGLSFLFVFTVVVLGIHIWYGI